VTAGAASTRIGPNAIIQVARVLPDRIGVEATQRLFEQAAMGSYVAHPPQSMVDESEVLRLHQVMRASLGQDVAASVAREAGLQTANYLLANRIPKPVQAVLKWLPAPLAARVLLMAIGKHAWTFAGSGHFSSQVTSFALLTIRENPLCRGVRSDVPACDFYTATFERLFQVLVHRQTRAREVTCQAQGADACRFELRW
jgi:divinyl protochlorophyllide a 8-vinyl-reductase